MATKQKIKMEVGKRYKGYGVLNEYGEYTFEPCQVIDNPDEKTKILLVQGDTTIYESKNLFRVSVKIEKKKASEDYGYIIHQVSTEIMRAVYQDRTYQGLTPTATLDFSNPGSTFASAWYTTEGKLVKNFSYQPTNGKVVMSAYAVYQSVNAERIAWEKFDSGNSSNDTWEATGDLLQQLQ